MKVNFLQSLVLIPYLYLPRITPTSVMSSWVCKGSALNCRWDQRPLLRCWILYQRTTEKWQCAYFLSSIKSSTPSLPCRCSKSYHIKGLQDVGLVYRTEAAFQQYLLKTKKIFRRFSSEAICMTKKQKTDSCNAFGNYWFPFRKLPWHQRKARVRCPPSCRV